MLLAVQFCLDCHNGWPCSEDRVVLHEWAESIGLACPYLAASTLQIAGEINYIVTTVSVSTAHSVANKLTTNLVMVQFSTCGFFLELVVVVVVLVAVVCHTSIPGMQE